MSLTESSQLVFEEYFNGKSVAQGLVMNRSGGVIRKFEVNIESSWVGNVGTLNEYFTWNNGDKTLRIWTVKKIGESAYSGTADDIIGTAIGASAGPNFLWNYRMQVKSGNSSYKIRFDDRMYKVSEDVILNEATMYWYGIRVGKILITFKKQ